MRLIVIIVIIAILGVGGYMAYSWPQMALRRVVEAEVAKGNAAAETGNKEAVVAWLGTVLAEDATVSLTISYGIPLSGNAIAPRSQQFRKDEFIRFMDLTLYALKSWEQGEMRLSGFEGNAEAGTAKAEVRGQFSVWDGVRTGAHYKVSPECQSQWRIQGETAQISKADCTVTLQRDLAVTN